MFSLTQGVSMNLAGGYEEYAFIAINLRLLM